MACRSALICYAQNYACTSAARTPYAIVIGPRRGHGDGVRPCPHLVGTVVRSRVGRPEVHAHLDGPPHREAVKIVPVAPPSTGSRAILDPRSKNWRHSTPRAPFWTLFWRATKAHSAPYACCECWASFASEHVQGSGPRTRTHCPSSAVRSRVTPYLCLHASVQEGGFLK